MLVEKKEPISFSPGIDVDDPLAAYWLRQVTVRMRREISWIWHERGIVTDTQSVIPPFSDRLQEALDMRRFWEQKNHFFENDTTACYLSDLLKEAPPPIVKAPTRGSFSWVVDTLALDELSTFVLALGLGTGFDNAMGSVIASCLNDPMKTYPTIGLVQKLWDAPERVLTLGDPAHPLFRHGLLHFGGQHGRGPTEMDWNSPIFVPSLVAKQLLYPETALPAGLYRLSRAGDPLVADEQLRLAAVRLSAAGNDGLSVIPIMGPSHSGHREIAQAIATIADRDVVEFRASPQLMMDEHYVNALSTLCWLKGMDLYIGEQVLPVEGHDKHRGSIQLSTLQTIPATIYLAANERSQIPEIAGDHILPAVNVETFTYHDRVACWESVLGEKAEGLVKEIRECARRFRYQKQTVKKIGRAIKALTEPLTKEILLTACRAELDLDIGDLAQKVTPRFRKEKLILPRQQALHFREIVSAMRSLTKVHYEWGTADAWNEGGITALFAGPPGTGKTMGAERLAMELDLPIYRIDLSQVVNKYIGETEKNLKRLFDAADASDMILFFDEADALFGRRTEVKDAHDRYANLEISYLLERMERFKGLAILATNRKKDLDEAFLRRLRYIVDFPLPDIEQRKAIWRQVMPDAVQSSDIDFDFLARQFPLVGGHIRSIVFNACLQIADDPDANGQLTMERLIKTVNREYQKLNRQISLEHFGPYTQIITQLESKHDAP